MIEQEMRRKEAIEMLLTIYDNIVEDDLCVLEGNTLIKNCKPDSLKFVIKEAILAMS